MLNIQRFVCNDIQENCYIVSDETKKAAIIDCGAQYEAERKAIRQYIEQQELQPEHLLVTHGHIDHNIGNAWVYKTYGLKPEVHSDDQKLMECLDMQAQAIMNTSLNEPMPPVGRYLTKDDTITIGNHIFSLLETPGHTPGGVFYYCEQEHLAFSGDTLFKGSIGRTDFEGGSMFMLIQSLRMISQLPDNTVILPGHGPQTTMGEEVAHNPYLDR